MKVEQPPNLRFESLADRLRRDCQEGLIPGAVMLVARDGRVEHLESCGQLGGDLPRPMNVDALFRIASMTKPITVAAALTLVDDGWLRIDDAVAAYLPELAGLQLASGEAPTRSMRILDLMRHTAGFTYAGMGDSPVHPAYIERDVYNFAQTNQEMVDKLASLPLLYEPGSTFEYGMSIDVLGRVIEVCTGEPLDKVMQERIFQPLGMLDTGFHIQRGDYGRVAHPFPHEPFSMAPPLLPAPQWLSGGGGLWSTANDYFRFAQMLLNGGELEGQRILCENSVSRMRASQLEPGTKFGSYTDVLGAASPKPDNGQSFGLGLSIRTREVGNALPGSIGDFTWPGMSGTNFWCDPAERLVVVVMMQAPSVRLRYRAYARELIYRDLRRQG